MAWLGFGVAEHMDVQRAMGLVRSKASSLGIDPSKIGVLGSSAGGHAAAALTTACSTAPTKRSYAPVDAADALSCRPDFAVMTYPWALDDRTIDLTVTAAHPPTFLSHSADDPMAPLLDNSLPYYAKLIEAGASAELHVFPCGGHGYGLCTAGTQKKTLAGKCVACTWPDRAARFLKDAVRPCERAGAFNGEYLLFRARDLLNASECIL